ncbi:MAG: hypothetical protein GY940_43215 [bacterium]|nr:hypothetical protein [bacterium]
MKHKLLFSIISIVSTCFVMVFFQFPGYGQERDIIQGDQLLMGKIVKLHSKVLNETRELWIYLPDGYRRSKQHYPVLYLLDGDSQFHHVTGITQFLSRLERIPKLVVVGIVNTNRDRDFLSRYWKTSDWPAKTGAKEFRSFLEGELIPFMDKTYRTSSNRILVGHSLGGIFCIETFLTNPELFSAYIAVSSTLQWADDYLVKEAPERLRSLSPFKRDKFLYFTNSGQDKESWKQNRQLEAVLKKTPLKKLRWEFSFREKETHGSNVHGSVYDGLETYYSGMRPSSDMLAKMDLAALKSYFKTLSESYGMTVNVPGIVTDQLGFMKFDKGKMDDAIKIFEYQLTLTPERFPNRVNLADVYYEMGKFELAKQQYELLLEMAKKRKHTYSITIAKEMIRQTEKMMKAKAKTKEKKK